METNQNGLQATFSVPAGPPTQVLKDIEAQGLVLHDDTKAALLVWMLSNQVPSQAAMTAALGKSNIGLIRISEDFTSNSIRVGVQYLKPVVESSAP